MIGPKTMTLLGLIALVLLGCEGQEPVQPDSVTTREYEASRIECRIGDAVQFERFCTWERGSSPAGATIIVRKPDGGFRRFLVTEDGSGVVAADGAEAAEVTIIADNRIEVAIGGDTYRLPATVRAQ